MSENKEDRFIGFNWLKQSVTMEQVSERYGLLEKLRRSGDSWSGVCPLHQGRNPTRFRVSLNCNCRICFGDCHAGGSIIDFVSRMEKVGNHLPTGICSRCLAQKARLQPIAARILRISV